MGLAISNFLCKTNYRQDLICSAYLFDSIFVRHLHSELMCQMKLKEMGEFGYIQFILFWERLILYMAIFSMFFQRNPSFLKNKTKGFWLPLPIHHIPSTSLLSGPCIEFLFDQQVTSLHNGNTASVSELADLYPGSFRKRE